MALFVGSAISLKGPAGEQGASGADGSRIYFITGTPTDTNASAKDGDVAFATDTNLLYQRTNGAWPTQGTLLRGGMGLTGVNGASFFSGPNPPDASVTGSDGDLFLALTTGEIFKHVNGAWADQGYSIMGPAGAAGAPGAPGQRGTQIYTGAGDFVASNYPDAQPSDLYIDTNGPTLYVIQSA